MTDASGKSIFARLDTSLMRSTQSESPSKSQEPIQQVSQETSLQANKQTRKLVNKETVKQVSQETRNVALDNNLIVMTTIVELMKISNKKRSQLEES